MLDGLRVDKGETVMTEKESLLAFIAEIENEQEQAEVYGEDWKRRDYCGRRSHAAGELCLTVASLAKAEAKAGRRPGSIGARKARQKAKADRRKLKELERIMAEPLKDYHPTEPQYISGPRRNVNRDRPERTHRIQYWPRYCRPEHGTGNE